MKKNIDYWLLWKSFNSKLNTTEEDQLNDWLKSDSKHRDYYKNLKSRNSGSAEDLYSQVDSNEDFKRVILLTKQRQFNIWRLSLVAASIIMIFSLGFFGYQRYLNEPSQILLENISFDPGVKKATLVLNDGHEVFLNESKDTVIKESDILIKNSESSLNYPVTSNNRNSQKYNKLLVPRGAEYYLELSDGSKVWVNSESILRYPVEFNQQERKIELIGEAYFEVKSDSSRPFIVTTKGQSIRVLGTSFNVKAYADEDNVTTSLVEGKVQLNTLKDTNISGILKPGYQSIYNEGANSFQIQKVNLRLHVSWKDGRFYFRQMQMGEIAKILSRWYDVDFEFKTTSIEKLKFNGNLARYDNIQPILNQLSKTNEITFYAYGKKIYVE